MLLRGSALTKWIPLGTLYGAKDARQKAVKSGAVTVRPGLATTNAWMASPQYASGFPTTAHSATDGLLSNNSSTSRGYTFSPPVMIMSFLRSTMYKYPSSSILAKSPVMNQSPRLAFSVASGRL